MPVTAGAVTLYMGPATVGGPDNLEAPIIAFMDAATRELLISVQELDHAPIAQAMIRARRRGVRVHMIMEQDYLREAKVPAANSLGTQAINRDLLMEVLQVGVDAKADYNPNIFHQKFVIRDRQAVLTGSTNFTTTGVTKNLNHIAIIDDVTVAREYAAEWRELRKGRFGRNSAVGKKPLEDHVVGHLRIKPLFAPDHMPEMEFIKQMIKASTRIDFAVFTFAQSSGIDDALVNAMQKGVAVQGVLDRKQANQKWAAKRTLQAVNIPLFKNKSGTGVRKVHHKLMVLDDAVTIIGSFNYTGPANLVNDENIVVLGDLDTRDPVQMATQKIIADYARTEITRIITDQSVPIAN